MIKIAVPCGTSRKLETITRPEIKIHHPAEKVNILVFNKTRKARVTITETETRDSIIVMVEDAIDEEFHLEL